MSKPGGWILGTFIDLDNGKEIPLTKGKLQIQSEGAEVYYRKIRIRSLEGIPGVLLK